MPSTFCPQCGAGAFDGDRFCRSCGASLATPDSPATDAQAPVDAAAAPVAPVAPVAPAAPAAPASGPTTVVIADDNDVDRALLAAIIADEDGFELVGQASDAAAAVAMVLELAPDLAILDWMMPAGGGTKATAQIRSGAPSTRIMGLTGSDDDWASLDMRRAGAAGFLIKGASRAELMSAVRRALAK
jgi:CheY-like chemotaxis protein